MHSDVAGRLSVVQTIKKNVKWGKNHAEKLLISDYNGDGFDDVFALAKKQNKAHYVVFSDNNGLLDSKNSKKIAAKIADKDWNADSYSVVADNINSDAQLELIRLHNALGGMDEDGNIITGHENIDVAAKTQIVQAVAGCSSLAYGVTTTQTTTTCAAIAVPATPGGIPMTDGSNYKPINVTYTITLPAVAGATYYKLYEAHTSSTATPADSSYLLFYSGNSGTADRAVNSTKYRWYRYRACNSAGCSGLSPYRRLYIYGLPGVPNNLAVSPLNVNVGASYTVAWTYSASAVDGTVYNLYERHNNTERLVYSVTRLHWSQHNYSYSTAKNTTGTYSYRVQACNPGVGCGGTSTTVNQTVSVPNTAPVANSDIAWLGEDSHVYVPVINNDTDEQNDALTATIYQYPSHGSLSIVNNMMYYVPTANFNGSDRFFYRAVDTAGAYSNAAAVHLYISAVNDNPTGNINIVGQATVGQTLTTTHSLSDIDGLGAVGYQWLRSGLVIGSATGSSYVLVNADTGHTITAIAN